MSNRLLLLGLACAGSLCFAAPALGDDPAHINAYIAPYYNSSGPAVRVGKFSDGLASKDEKRFVDTIQQMKRQWQQLSFVELYVGAIRLYDLGYRNEATYWFYSAQYEGKLFSGLLDTNKMGTIGSPGFELNSAQGAFFQLAGPNINGYAFGNLKELESIIRRVQHERQNAPDMQALYPHVIFVSKSKWRQANAQVNAGLGQLLRMVQTQGGQVATQRATNGTAARFSHVTSKQFPRGF